MAMVDLNSRAAQLQIRQNADNYAKIYAERNGISVEDAKEELRAEYGNPGENLGNVSIFASQTSENSYYDFDFAEFDYFDNTSSENLQTQNNNSGIKGLFQKFLDFLKGGNGPKEEGDPQSHINPETNTMSGPQKEGDFNPEKGIYKDVKMENGKDPDKIAQQYAEANNMSIEEAKKQLKELYGEPQQK